MTSGIADNELRYAEERAREYGVTATPSWLVDDQLVVGLRPRTFFAELGETVASSRPRDGVEPRSES